MKVNNILDLTKEKMNHLVQHNQQYLKSIQAHKITRETLDGVKVNVYQSETPLHQLCRINVVDPQTLSVEPYEKSLLNPIESAIRHNKKDYFVRQNKNGLIYVSQPPLTEERRKKIVKEVQQQIEQAKINIRNKRIEAKKQLKNLEKQGTSEDEIKKAETTLEKITAQHIQSIDDAYKVKEKNLMTV